MSAGHTPGPWWITDSGVRDRGCYICHTHPAQRYPGQEERFARETAERAANKALIAAGPDLFAALERLLHWGQAMGPDTEFTGDHPIAQARAAIAKATGVET